MIRTGSTSPRVRRRVALRRGFTLLEMMLAAFIGSLVVLACMVMFGFLMSSDARSARRQEAVQQLSRLHNTMSEAMSNMVVMPATLMKARPINSASTTINGAGSGGTGVGSTQLSSFGTAQPNTLKADGTANVALTRPGTDANTASLDSTAASPKADLPPEPRVILDTGPTGFQRLEMVLNGPPVLGSLDGTVAVPEAEQYQMVRGAFEVRPSPSDDGTRSLLDLWYVMYASDDAASGTADSATGQATVTSAGGSSRTVKRELLVAKNLTSFKWTMYRTNQDTSILEPLTSVQATTANEIPAYAELDVTTAEGPSAKWMFEVGWTTIKDVGQTMAMITPMTRPVTSTTGGLDNTGAVATGGDGTGAGGTGAGSTTSGSTALGSRPAGSTALGSRPAGSSGGTSVAVSDNPNAGLPPGAAQGSIYDNMPDDTMNPNLPSDAAARQRYIEELERYREKLRIYMQTHQVNFGNQPTGTTGATGAH